MAVAVHRPAPCLALNENFLVAGTDGLRGAAVEADVAGEILLAKTTGRRLTVTKEVAQRALS